MKNDLALLGPQSKKFVFAEHGMVVDGVSMPSSGGGTIPVFDPSSGEQIAAVPEGTVEDVDHAVKAARKAFEDPSWAGLKPAARERLILKLALALEEHAQEFAEIESLNSGRLLWLPGYSMLIFLLIIYVTWRDGQQNYTARLYRFLCPMLLIWISLLIQVKSRLALLQP